ncbi:MAG: hypothetical protein LBK83_11145 [Treponema sp.]|nr:hypothetical protein [Treponema sp.]
MKKNTMGLIAVLLAAAVMGLIALVAGCATPGKPATPTRDTTVPDESGNIVIRNTAGVDVALYVNDVYIRSVPKGRTGFVINVADATDPNGTGFGIKAYDNDKKGSITEPSQSALLHRFSMSLYPKEDTERQYNLVIPESTQRDKELLASGGTQVLVRFEYPLEDMQLGTIFAQIFTGQINSRRNVVTMNPYDKPLYVPFEPGSVQLSVLYEVSLNKDEDPVRFYWPAFNKAAVNASYRVFNTNEVDPVYRIRPVTQMAKVSYIYQEDNFGKVIVKNTGSDAVTLKAARISVDGKYGNITQIARSGGGGSSDIPVSPVPISFTFEPGPYQFWAEETGFDTGKRVGTNVEIDIEAGSTYHWIINNRGGSFTEGASKDATRDLLVKLQKLTIRSNPAGAQVKIGIESGVPDEVGRFEKDIGSTDARGLLTIQNAAGDFVSSFPGLTSGLTNKNASKVTVQFTVSRDGYIPVTQAINVLTLLEAGDDFRFDDFNLARIASGSDPNAVPTLELVGEDVAKVPAGM